MSVVFEASGENVNPLASSFASKNPSTAVRTRLADFGAGTGDAAGLRNAQKARSSSGTVGGSAIAGWIVASAPAAPESIHLRITAIS